VLGNSVGYYLRPPATSREEADYGELIEREMRARGVDTWVHNSCGWFLSAAEGLAQVEERAMHHSPDVVILNFGIVESEPGALPLPLLKAVYTWRQPLVGPRAKVRRMFLRPVHLFHQRFGPSIIRTLRLPGRVSPASFKSDMSRLIDALRKERAGLVLVLNINPPNPRIEANLPGSSASARRYNQLLAELVGEMDDRQVRLVDVAGLVTEKGTEALLPDGVHFNAEGHRLAAELLVAEIQDWLDHPLSA
jgi:lysophospholipase L1-like esterase